jgi:putative iron-only hydrogenase system regulator
LYTIGGPDQFCILTVLGTEPSLVFAAVLVYNDINLNRENWCMETRVAVISIIVENIEAVETLNKILHEYGQYIIGRMGIPYRDKGINIISIAVDAPNDRINELTGSIGRLPGVTAKAAYSKA